MALTVSWVDLRCVIVVFPDYTYLPFNSNACMIYTLYTYLLTNKLTEYYQF